MIDRSHALPIAKQAKALNISRDHSLIHFIQYNKINRIFV
jgi:hypothetical protein